MREEKAKKEKNKGRRIAFGVLKLGLVCSASYFFCPSDVFLLFSFSCRFFRCGAFSTYPRTYDLIPVNCVFSLYKESKFSSTLVSYFILLEAKASMDLPSKFILFGH